ncbi:peptidylprolyl isomerase [Helicobacter sp. MIT 14-3879]|uniref:peptidylprolyl isomerase n=1 Tax=Helicobacter sp. MIT 14-3879 TaxID=2040649 RepID=UPI000E1E9164|nr:peptidylprolyl isomerase [Helicobacter sp. MIT 14-3879]RDU60578.1 peptidylprolyl isomerase [Helicobacter sp. MIT 14-3879]
MSIILANALRKATIAGCIVLPAILGTILHAKTIVTVDGTEVSDSIFIALKQQNPNFNYDALPEAQKKQLLDEIITGILTANAAKKEGLEKTEEYRMGSLQLLSSLWLKRQVDSLSKTVNVTEAEAQKFYNDNSPLFITQNAKLLHILVTKEEEAKNIIAEIGKVPKNKIKDKFSELAKKHSIDPGSKENGGLIDKINLSDPNIAPEFAQEVKKMTANSYNKTPIKSRYGFHIVYLEKIDQPIKDPFTKVKTQLIERLKQKKIQEILQGKVDKMKDAARITY